MDQFDEDQKSGEIGELFLIEYLMPEIAESYEHLTTDGEKDNGDIKASIPEIGENLVIDVKTQSDYAGDPVWTFVLELTQMQKSDQEREQKRDLRPGWFIDQSNSTTHYAFMWIDELESSEFNQPEDIHKADVLIVSHDRIEEFLREEVGLNRNRLLVDSTEVRFERDGNAVDVDYNGVRYHYTKKKPRTLPVNLIVDYDIYERLAGGSYVIDDGEVLHEKSLQ